MLTRLIRRAGALVLSALLTVVSVSTFVDASPINWTGGRGGVAAPNVPNPAADQQAPTVPTRLIATPFEDGITYTWDQSADKHDGSLAGTGLASYILNLDGVDQTAITAGVNSNVLARPTCSEIGSTGSTLTQAGNDDSFASTNTSLDTTDTFPHCYWTLTGDFTLSTQLVSMSSVGTVPAYAFAGLEVRVASDSPDNAERHQAWGQYLSASGRGLQQVQRLAAGGDYSYFGSATGVGSASWVQIDRTGDVWSYYYSFDGSTWNSIGSQTLAWPSTVRVGAFSSSYGTGTLTTLFRDLKYTQSARLSYTHNVAYPATVVAKVKARDGAAAANSSTYSATVSASPLDSTPAPTASRKWYPGHYVRADSAFFSFNESATYALLDDIKDEPNVQGIGIILPIWVVVKGANEATWNWTPIDDLLEAAAAVDKKVTIEPWWMTFDPRPFIPVSPQSEGSKPYLPDHWNDNGWSVVGTFEGEPNAYTLKTDSTAAVSALAAFLEAMAERYDDDPTLANVVLTEVSQAWAEFEADQAGVGGAILDNYRDILIPRVGAAFAHTPTAFIFNFPIQNQTKINQCKAAMLAVGMGFSDTDIHQTPAYGGTVDNMSMSNFMLVGGAVPAGSYYTGINTGSDLRGVVPAMWMQEFAFSGSATQLYNYAYNDLNMNMIMWTAGDISSTGAGRDYDGAVRPLITNSANVLHTTCPTAYAGTCTTP